MKFPEFLSRTFAVIQTITIRQDNEITCIVASIYKIHNNTVSNFTITKMEVLDPCCVNLGTKNRRNKRKIYSYTLTFIIFNLMFGESLH